MKDGEMPSRDVHYYSSVFESFLKDYLRHLPGSLCLLVCRNNLLDRTTERLTSNLTIDDSRKVFKPSKDLPV